MRIAIIGSGIAGLSCARILDARHEVVVFEAADQLAGHASTTSVTDPDAGALDVVLDPVFHNDRSCPTLTRLLNEHNVASRLTEMSFGVVDCDPASPTNGIEFQASSPNTLFTQSTGSRRAALRSTVRWRMVADATRFSRHVARFLTTGALPHQAAPATLASTAETLVGEFLDLGDYSAPFVELMLGPLTAHVANLSPTIVKESPARNLLRVLSNRELIGIGRRPAWQTVVGGTGQLSEALTDRLRGDLRLSTTVHGISRLEGSCIVRSSDSEHQQRNERFDRVIVACAADAALDLLDDPTTDEKDVLGAIRYEPTRSVLHTDTSVLPGSPSARAAVNYRRHSPHRSGSTPNQGHTLTYDLSEIQELTGRHRYLLSLVDSDVLDPETVIASFDDTQPVFDAATIEAQRRFIEIDGINRVHFCGAWWGYGSHEDAVMSAVDVTKRVGVRW